MAVHPQILQVGSGRGRWPRRRRGRTARAVAVHPPQEHGRQLGALFVRSTDGIGGSPIPSPCTGPLTAGCSLTRRLHHRRRAIVCQFFFFLLAFLRISFVIAVYVRGYCCCFRYRCLRGILLVFLEIC
uniref:Uncharacterized protein n=1 Tax=Anopheles funestus TaxID=62324 RepID=A0A182S3T3_ANOFN